MNPWRKGSLSAQAQLNFANLKFFIAFASYPDWIYQNMCPLNVCSACEVGIKSHSYSLNNFPSPHVFVHASCNTYWEVVTLTNASCIKFSFLSSWSTTLCPLLLVKAEISVLRVFLFVLQYSLQHMS